MFELVDQYLRLCGHVRDSLSACVRACIVLGYQFIGHPHFRVRAGGVTGEVPGAAGVRYAAGGVANPYPYAVTRSAASARRQLTLSDSGHSG